jgi:putative ABC transport system permease protein
MTITGLAAVVVGRLLAPKAHRPEVLAVSVVGGAVTYKLLIWGALSMGVPPESFRILSSVLLIAVFVFARRADLGLLKGMKWS